MIKASNDKTAIEWVETETGLLVPDDCRPKPRPKAVDIFAGCGGFSLGLMKAGFDVVGAVEMDFWAAQTYMVNLSRPGVKIHFDTDKREADFAKCLEKTLKKHEKEYGFPGLYGGIAGAGAMQDHPEWSGCQHFWIADVRTLTGEMILKEIGLKRGELDLVCGGPPCQGYSRAGKQDINDPRNSLIFEYARLIVELNPKTFVMEEVPDIVKFRTPDGTPVLEEFCRIIADGDYAPYESARKMLGLAPTARRVMRNDFKPEDAVTSKKKPEPKKRLASAARHQKQPELFA